MSDFYHYIDPQFAYTDPETGLLKNLKELQILMSYSLLRAEL